LDISRAINDADLPASPFINDAEEERRSDAGHGVDGDEVLGP
jgi:hypothetical protein